MICKLKKKDVEELQTTNILPQTAFWGRIKSNQGLSPIGFELTVSKNLLYNDTDSFLKTGDDILVLLKYIDNSTCFAYVPYGPKLEPSFENQGLFLEQLSESIKPFLPANCIFIRYDLIWENQWAIEDQYFDDSGNWIGAPRSQVQEYRVNFKTAKWNLKKSVNDFLPKNTFFIDLSITKQKLLSNMRYNTRYNVKKALMNGISVKEYSIEYMNDWYKLYYDTAARHNMPLQSQEYFSTILKTKTI